MPPEIIDQSQRMSFFTEELRFPTERQVGFWKPESLPDIRGSDDISTMVKSKLISSSVVKPKPIGPSTMERSKFMHHSLFNDQTMKFGLDSNLLSAKNLDSVPQSNTCGFNYENGIFSSSLSEIFETKLDISSNIASIGRSVSKVNSNFEEEELPHASLKEIEAQTIGDLLPDDDDLLSGVIDDIECIAPTHTGDDVNDDIFFSGGGLELEIDDNHIMKSDNVKGGIDNPYANEHPHSECPSRTLFVRNIDGNLDDKELKLLFEQYGDIWMLYTACKHRGFVMISYYDIRAAQSAMKSLQNKVSKHGKLDIHYSIPKDNPSEEGVNQGTLVVFNLDSSISNDYLLKKFGMYGEIKEIREVSHNQNFIEFYDVRAAENAVRALNRSDIGMKVKLEPSRVAGAIRLTQQLSPEMELEESRIHKQFNSPYNSPPIHYGTVSVGSATSFENVTGLQAAVRAPLNPLIPSSRTLGLSSPVRVSSEGRYIDPNIVHSDYGHSFDHLKFGVQNAPMMHPHSLPEYHDGLTNDVLYNSSPMHSMAININYEPEGVDNRFLQRVCSGGFSSHSFESGSFGSMRNDSFPIHNNQFIWNNGNAYHHQSSTPVIWNSSPSFINNIPPHLHGLPRAPSHMLSPVMPFHPHHVGSAPAVNPSIWERRQVELPHNMFDQVGIPSHQQSCHMFQGRNQMIPTHATCDSPGDRIRGRRNDLSAHQADNKKQFELDIGSIIRGEDSRTTLMIKNIPNKYTSKMLLAAIDENHKGTYDFIYLPIDFKNKCNVGYAFINMIDPHQIVPFFQAFNGKKWEKFNSEKVASLAYARIQGKAALIAHFQNSSLMNEDKRCRPIIFHSDGPNVGDQEPFPMGMNIRSRHGRTRTYGSEENSYRSPSTSPDNTGPSN